MVELDRVAGEPWTCWSTAPLIAHGEVVVVNDKFGIRLTDVISQIERIKNSNDPCAPRCGCFPCQPWPTRG